MLTITVNGTRPAPYLATLAEFKRFLADPTASVRGLYHWRQDAMQAAVRESFFGRRTVKALQTNGVWWNTGAWLDFGKASEWVFGCADGQPIAQRLLENGEVCFTFALDWS